MGRRKIPVSTLMTIERDGEEIQVLVEGQYFFGTPGVRYLPNGDPGCPGDPPEVEDIIACHHFELTDAELERAHQLLVDTVSIGDEPDVD